MNKDHPNRIEFSPIDRMICIMIGGARNASAGEDGRRLEAGRCDFGFDRHTIGAFGEFAVARFLNINWHPVVGQLDTERGDVGAKVQVKSSLTRDNALFVRKQDPADFIYIRCHVTMMWVELMGWAHGKDVKIEENWHKPPKFGLHQACFVYPQDRLLPMDALKPECYT